MAVNVGLGKPSKNKYNQSFQISGKNILRSLRDLSRSHDVEETRGSLWNRRVV